ncbi:hypothetical protein [Marinobacterium rhizophilum]|uniref:Uncharacterized protein n=1 Tax=Marinobacterium rhizophilum TaxID=420402 RepID=A0ABY5HJ94_9GAMM|nr:hypothetical protein [Marinobacterium rhizophilum]UTW11342.1 hypothetical protein KDW95_19065 [Marinobacterium rhizophilum]
MMHLPGGLLLDDRLERGFALTAPSGSLDMRLHRLAETSASRGQWLTDLLCELLQHLGGEPATRARVERLCLADRQAIVLAWRARREPDPQWWHLRCHACEHPFDVPLSLQALPCSAAGPNFPFARAETSAGPLTLRIPDGRDLCWLAQQQDKPETRKALVMRLLIEPSDAALSDADIAAVEAAIEAEVPELAETLDADCPECGTTNRLAFDPCQGLVPALDPLLDDIHRLAAAYHWSEAEILALPEPRRRQYLQRIDGDRGMQTRYAGGPG